MDKTKTIAIVAVVIIVVAACVVVLGNGGGNKDKDTSFSIVDGNGTTFDFDGPIDGIVSVNTNVPKAMKILGYEDQLKGISFYTSSADTDSANWEKYKVLFPNSAHMSITKSLTAEEIVDTAKVKYVVAPVSSMTVSSDQEKAYNLLGIQVIRLDCNGDTVFDDYEKLITLFNGVDKENQKYNDFKNTYDGVVNTVIEKSKSLDAGDKTVLSYFNSKKAFYNQNAVVSENIEKIYGKNALRSIDGLDLSGISNAASTDGLKEKIIELDAKKPIDKIFIRGSASTSDASAALKVWTGSEIYASYSSLSAVENGEVYVFNSEMMSGSMSYIGFVIYAEICGVDTGYDTAELMKQYNEKYGFDESTTGLAFKIADGAAIEVVVN